MKQKTFKPKLSKKVLCITLSVIIALGTFITFTVGYSPLHDWLGIRNMLSAYAAEIVDTKGVVAVDEEAMLADDHTINLENKDGSNTVYLFSEPISFTDDNGDLKTKDITVEKSNSKLRKEGYEYTNGQNDYRINFSKDYNKGVNVQGKDYSYSLMPQSTIKVEGSESVAEYLGETFEVFQYENIYGNKTNLRFYPQLNGIKDEIVLEENINKNVFDFELKCENCIAKLNEDNSISLVSKDGKTVVQTITPPYAYDSKYVEGDDDDHKTDCKYLLEKKDNNTYILSVCVPNEWLSSESTIYPVIIDPTTVNASVYKDAGVYSKYSSNNYGSETTCCFGRSSDYGYGRVLNKFTMPSGINVGATINSAYLWERETTGRTTSTQVTAYMGTSSWYEGEVTWSNKPGYNTEMTTRTINSNSSDNSSSPYWYKFNIAKAVKKWADGTTNWGICFISQEEQRGSYNWRAFASEEYSTSSYRPYAVISYTNDTTAPTATVAYSPTGWTNTNVTVSISGASDNSGGAGLHSSPYSFSTTSGSYSWGTATSKSYSSNTTVYACVRDAVGNIKTYPIPITNIDKLKPNTPTATVNPSGWTQNNVAITVQADDAAATSANGKSGVKYYSCTKTAGVYDWKTASTHNGSYTFNNIDYGTYYIYAKDQAGNISNAKTVIAKVDNSDPVVNIIDVTAAEGSSDYNVHIEASDSPSGINAYSLDGGNSWVTLTNSDPGITNLDTTVTTNLSENEIDVRVKDLSGRTSNGNIVNLANPEFYSYDGKAGVLNPNLDGKTIEYSTDNNSWEDYTEPIDITETTTVYARYKSSNPEQSYSSVSKEFSPLTEPEGVYTENATDLTIANNNLSFDITRDYSSDSNEWRFSTETSASLIHDGKIVKVNMPDNSNLYFVKTAENTYVDEVTEYTLNETDDDYNISADGEAYSFSKSSGRMLSISDEFNHQIEFSYNSNDVLTSITAISGNDEHPYSVSENNGKIESITTPLNDILCYKYDNSHLEYVYYGETSDSNEDDFDIILAKYSYNNDDLLSSTLSNDIRYDNSGRVTHIINDDKTYKRYVYGANNSITTSVYKYRDKNNLPTEDPTSSVTEYYDTHHNVIKSVDLSGKVTRYIYDRKNRLTEVKEKESEESETETVIAFYIYNEDDDLESVLEDGITTHYIYDDNHKLQYFFTENELTVYTYSVDTETVTEFEAGDDSFFNTLTLAELIESGTQVKETVTVYEEGTKKVSSVTETDDSNSESTVTTVTQFTNGVVSSVSVTDSSKPDTTSLTEYEYTDGFGNNTKIKYRKDDNNAIYDSVVTYTYDSLNRCISTETRTPTEEGEEPAVDIKTTETAYNADGTVATETNALGVETMYSYNKYGQKTAEEFDIYELTYNEDGKILTSTVDGDTYAEYNYNSDGNPASIVYNNGQSIYYNYDEETGNLVSQSRGSSNATPYVEYTYDRIPASEVENTQIDTASQLDTEPETEIDTNEHYIIKTKSNHDSGLFYRYFEDGEVKVYNENNTQSAIYTYIISESDTDSSTTVNGNIFDVAYSSTLAENGITHNYGNNTLSKSVSEGENGTTVIISNAAGTVLSYTETESDETVSRAYNLNGNTLNISETYNADGKITSATEGNKTTSYEYYSDGQLQSVTSNGYSASYQYSKKTGTDTNDNRGNIVSKTIGSNQTGYIYDTNLKDRLISYNENAFTYDNIGNVLTYGNKSYTWNSGRNLQSIVDGNKTYSYTYNKYGYRTSKTTTTIDIDGETTQETVTTYFNVDDNGTIISQNTNNNIIYFEYDNAGAPLGFVSNGTQYIYITNISGDVIGIADSTGNILATYSYDEWGKVTVNATGEESLALANLNPLRYRGYYYDNETGYYYLQSRYYDPEICRFINADLPEYAQVQKNATVGINLFAYCCNDAINDSDKTGKAIATIVIKAVSKMLLGVLAQYTGDIIYNICSGKKGTNVFKPSSSVGDYISAALCSLIPGNRLVSCIARATVTTAISTFEYTIKTRKSMSLKKILITLLKNIAIDVCCTVISSAFAYKLNSMKPKNYSQFAHSQYLKNAKMTPEQIKRNMRIIVRRIIVSVKVFDFFTNAITNAVSRKF